MEEFNNNESHNTLLRGVRDAVVSVLTAQTSSGSCWSIVGSLEHILVPLRVVLSHRLREVESEPNSSKKYSTFWPFVSRMRHLNTIYSSGLQQFERIECISEYRDRADIWLDSSLRTFNIAHPLQLLLNCRDHVQLYYFEDAFMMDIAYTNAMIICLQSLESNKIEMLAEINVKMLVDAPPKVVLREKNNAHSPMRRHRRGHCRSSSLPMYPNTDYITSADIKLDVPPSDEVTVPEHLLSRMLHCTTAAADDLVISTTPTQTPPIHGDVTIVEHASFNQSPSKARGHVRSISDLCLSSMNKSPQFNQPLEGQSLLSFLKSQDFKTCAELDKENSHFSISEALISAIEQMRCNQFNNRDNEEVESDDEIEGLKQRIRIRRHARQREKAANFHLPTLHDNVSMATSADVTSASPASSFYSRSSSGESFSTIDDVDIEDTCHSNLLTMSESGITLSMASLYSEIDLHKSNQKLAKTLEREESCESRDSLMNSQSGETTAAEMVAIALLRRFNDKQIPNASDLVWLVSESDAPQTLLPLPDSVPISPGDDYHHLENSTRIRGELDWAPPRPQIIFNIQPKPRRELLLEKQNWRCAGCGARVENGFHTRYRYCTYTGKYYCPRCHSNSTSVIPARVIRKWDFNRYRVSNFTLDLLIRLYDQPLYDMEAIRPAWYTGHHSAREARDIRCRIASSRSFIACCRKADIIYAELKLYPAHLFTDTDVYSICDFEQVKSGVLVRTLRKLFTEIVAHINNCELCQAKGFICELCKNNKDILFPFNFNLVHQCKDCKSCFHTKCRIKNYCPKCNRIENRRKIEKGRIYDEED